MCANVLQRTCANGLSRRILKFILIVCVAIGAYYFAYGLVVLFTLSAFEMSNLVIDVGRWSLGWRLLLRDSAILAGIVASLLVIAQLTTGRIPSVRTFAWVLFLPVSLLFGVIANHTLTHWFVFAVPMWSALCFVVGVTSKVVQAPPYGKAIVSIFKRVREYEL